MNGMFLLKDILALDTGSGCGIWMRDLDAGSGCGIWTQDLEAG